MIAYRILKNGYFGGEVTLPDSEKGTPPYVTRTPVQSIPEGCYALWNGRGWTITSVPPRPVDETPKSIELPIHEIFDYFGNDKWNILSSQDSIIKAFVLDCSVRKSIDISDNNFQYIIKYMIETYNFEIDPILIRNQSIDNLNELQLNTDELNDTNQNNVILE
jgi:hypothetical protein